MFNKLKQIKDVRQKAKSIQSALAEERVEGSAGWGKVKVTIDGNQKVQKVTIDPEVIGNKEQLEGLIKEAVNDGVDKVQKVLANKMKDLGGMDLAQDMQELMRK
ncbi:MAG: YbaB/EbfC family nucleoid-associated protein [Patescibacteria group bacterium]|nr:YbaB/EbfC family nucleoid-associated protein [Patescibacteria group bacterium]MBU2509145.1 YbaB/EbfC family nucleoid-associated protein [Patescibacteria group bacterium]